MSLDSGERFLIDNTHQLVQDTKNDLYFTRQDIRTLSNQLFLQSKILRRMTWALVLTNAAVIFMCAAFLIFHFLHKLV